MSLQGFITSIIFIVFPFTIYLIYLIYIKNMDLEEKNIFLELSIFTSLYLVLKIAITPEYINTLTLFHLISFNIPLLIAYLKKKYISAIIISFVLILYFYRNLDRNLSILIAEYFTYFTTYVFLVKKRPNLKVIINNFVVIKTFILSVKVFTLYNPYGEFHTNIIMLLLAMTIFTVVAYIIMHLLNVSEEIIDLNNSLCELEKEKMLRSSLFKLTHEIKNPIAVCKGYLDMFDYNDSVKIRKYIPIVKGEIERSIGLMDDFLDYTKIKITKDEVDLYMLIEEVWDSTDALFKKNDIKGKLTLPDEELYLELDYNRIKQVFVNLFKNSIEAKDAKRKMKVELATSIKDDHVEILIKDSGKGMDEETLNNIGEMFYTTKNKGTGLGVALTKEIIELHGGSIEYKSILEKGTIVSILLPLEETKKV